MQSVLFAGTPLVPFVLTFVTALDVEKQCIRTKWMVLMIMDETELTIAERHSTNR